MAYLIVEKGIYATRERITNHF